MTHPSFLPIRTILFPAPICHGAGRKCSTLSDLVVEMEYVDCNGSRQTVTGKYLPKVRFWDFSTDTIIRDPQVLRAASGCFGLLGIVTSVTLRVDRMCVALMSPEKPRVALTIPPPKGYSIPAGVDMSGISQNDLDEALKKFEKQCEMDYSEFFWFPYNRRCWVNCWQRSSEVGPTAQAFPEPYVRISFPPISCHLPESSPTHSPTGSKSSFNGWEPTSLACS